MARKKSTVELYGELMDEVEQDSLRPVYFLFGEERLLIDRLCAAIRQQTLRDGVPELNHDVVVAAEVKPEQLAQMARTVPMMGTRRLVEVREAHQLKAPALEAFLPYIDEPSPQTVLLFIAQKVDTRLKFFRALTKRGYLARFDAVKGAPLTRFLAAEAKRLGARLDSGVAGLIVDLVGNDLLALAAAVEKLSLYVGEGKVIRADDVDEVVSATRQAVIFELTDAVGEGNTDHAMRILDSMLEAGEPEQRILVMIARQLRLIWSALDARAQGVADSGLASAIGVPPFVARRIAGQARRFSPRLLRQAHTSVYRADIAMKTSRVPRPIVLEKLVLDLCGGRPTHFALRPPPDR